MSYFRLGSSSEDTVKDVLLVLSILLITIITESDLTLLQGPTAVFVISGVLLIIISFISIFMVFECIGKEN